MDPQLKAQCRQTIYVATEAARSSFGDPSFNAAAAVRCRCEPDDEASKVTDGEQRITRYRIVTESKINTSDRVWLPGDDQTNATLGRTPLKVQECPGETGAIDHYETTV